MVSGRVQGVCFRMCTVATARRLGLAGWVRNRPDGSVEITAEGEETALRQLADWCGEGPSYARVTDARVSYADALGEFSEFAIRY